MKPVLALVLATSVVACATQHPLTPTAAAGLKGRRLALTVRSPTPLFARKGNGEGAIFVPVMSGALMGAFAGAAVAGLSGNESDRGARIIREHGLADPAQLIAVQLGEDLRRSLGVELAKQAIYVPDDDLSRITAADPSADLALDVWVNSLRLQPRGKKLGYGLSYGAYVRLIDAKVVHPIDGRKGIVIAHGSCSRPPSEIPGDPSYDEFLAHGAERLKFEVDLAAQFCADQLRATVLGMGKPPSAGATTNAQPSSRPQSASSISTDTGK
jgi:hypothetical protein